MGDHGYGSSNAVNSAPADRLDPKAFWIKQFANLDAEQFPLLPAADYTPRPTQSAEYNIEGLGWDSSAFKPSIFIRLAWAILQSRYTNCDDVLFGAAAGVNGTAFPNRVQLARGNTVSDALRSLQTQAEQMALYRYVDYTEIIQHAGTEADAARDFKTLLVLTSASARPAQQRERRRQSLVDFYALTMECTITHSGLWIRFVHDPAVVSDEQVERMSSQLGHTLRQILMQPQSQVGEITTASEEDLQDIWSWNKTVTETVDTSLFRSLARAPSSCSDAIAVDAWDGKITYSELDELSTRLAFHLAALGADAGTIVPLCLEKSKWTSVAMIAVMKSGAVSMCLNANHPAEYLRGIVHRSQPSALICSPTTAPLASKLTDQIIITISDEYFAKLNIEPLEPLPAIKPSDILCVIPTSGNLVRLTHSNLATALLHQTKLFEITQSSRIYDLDSYNSDLIWLNHLLAFTNGACLCVPSDQERKGDLAESISNFRASVLITTAASAKHIDLSQAVDLQTLVVSGGSSPKLELPPHVRVVSVYGVAESTILATCATEQQVMKNEKCLGRGLAGNTWIVSPVEPRELCAVGEIGELWLESPLVGAGYVGDEKKTIDCFVDNPEFLARGGPNSVGRQGRLLRTGTLVRYLPDGTLAFVGYRDPRIKKIRGHRVNLAEIEGHVTQLLEDKASDVAVEVIAAQGQPAPVITLFIAPAGNLSDSAVLGRTVAGIAETLSAGMKQLLPSHMLPVFFLPIRTLPRKTNGEVDRKKLRQDAERNSRDQEQRTATHAIRPQRAMTILEVQLQQLWSQILGIKDRTTIHANSDWLQLGGDESSAMRLSNAAQNWGLDISAADVLARPRLADMAECVKHFHRASIVAPEGVDQPMRRGTFESGFGSASSYDGRPATPRMVAKTNNMVDRRRSSILVNGKEELPAAPMTLVPVTAVQKRALMGGPGRTPIGTEYFAYDLSPSLDPAKVIDACRKLVHHFDILRTVFVQIQDAIYQTILPEVEVPIEVQQIVESLEATSQAVLQKDSHIPLTLGRSFLRIYILQKPSEHMRIILRTNQAYTDAQSISTLHSALSDVLAGKPLDPAASFNNTILQHSATPSDSSISYWRNLLLGSMMSFIPRSPTTTTTQPTTTVSASSMISLPTLPSTITPETLFLATCSSLLLHLLKQPREVLFGHIISTRPASSSSSIIVGSCKNLIPIRVRKTLSILRQVQEQISSISNNKTGLGMVDFATVANDNHFIKDAEGFVEKGDFGLITEWVDELNESGSREGLLAPKEEAVKMGRSCAVVIRGVRRRGEDVVKVEISARSDVQSPEMLATMLGAFERGVKELGRDGGGQGMMGKRKASLAEGFF